MRYHVNEDVCIGCGLCVSTCPQIFFLTEEGLTAAKPQPVPAEHAALAAEAMENCPTEAISREDG